MFENLIKDYAEINSDKQQKEQEKKHQEYLDFLNQFGSYKL